ncbi:MAG TPA: cytochrome c [Chloroflexota bacterium]|jgi:mono/diheme cytochrome c family protein
MPSEVGLVLGIILFLLVIFAAAYASGWSPHTAAPSGEEPAGGLSAERKLQIVIALSLALGVLMLIYGLTEPTRQAEAYQRQKETSIERGQHFFATYCYTCHGYNGQGAIVPGQEVMAANLTLRKATGVPDDDKKLFDFLTKTITRGRPNTPMPAWGLSDGGSLQPEEINELAIFIMNGDFSHVEAEVAPGAPTPNVPTGGGGANAAATALISSHGCGACHTIQSLAFARGTIGPNLTDLGNVAGTMKPGMAAKDYIRESILQPSAFIVPGFPGPPSPMPPFTVGATSSGTSFTEQDLDTLIDYLSRLGTPEQNAPSGGAAGGAAAGGAAGGGATTPTPGAASSTSGGAQPPTAVPSGTGAGGGAAQPNPASAPGGQVTTPSPNQPTP